MKTSIAVLMAALLGTAAVGEELLVCLGPDVVRSIVAPTTTNNDIAVSDEVPAELADYPIPAEFDWIGAIHGEVRKIAAYATNLPAAEALAIATGSLVAAGWNEAAAPPRLSAFVFDGAVSSASQLCRDDRNFSLTVRDANGRRYINLSYPTQAASSSACGLSARASRPNFMDAMAADTPTLRFPPGTTQNGGTSGGGSNQRLRTSTRITSDLAPAALVAYLGEQMSEQGWTIDSSWAGQRGAGGSWVRESESGARVVNSLAIIERGNDSFEVQLTTLTL